MSRVFIVACSCCCLDPTVPLSPQHNHHSPTICAICFWQNPCIDECCCCCLLVKHQLLSAEPPPNKLYLPQLAQQCCSQVMLQINRLQINYANQYIGSSIVTWSYCRPHCGNKIERNNENKGENTNPPPNLTIVSAMCPHSSYS